jgi:WD40 repeat protein
MTRAVCADDELEQRLVEFDSAWGRRDEPGGSRGGPGGSPAAPAIDDFLVAADASMSPHSRRELLTQLVMVDLEYRWRAAGGAYKNGHADAETSRASTQGPLDAASRTSNIERTAWKLEDYLAQYPELGPAEDLSLELIGQEFRVRQRFGDQPRPDEYLARFPYQAASLSSILSEIDAEVTHESRRRVPADTRFGRFELLEILGEGGMGTVFRALDTGLARVVALKMIRTGQLATPAEVALFRQEAETAARLHHPHIVTVYEVGEQQGQHFFTMQLIDGPNLADYLPELLQRPASAARLVATIARAVHYAHQRGVLHRDLKPSNILLDGDGRPYVSDFGLAKRLDADTTATHSAALAGTPSFMSPEQAAGRRDLVTTATDVYGLGAVLYTLLSGRPPFTAETPAEVQRRVLDDSPEPLCRQDNAIDRDLETICLKCLDKEPPRRYGSAEALAEDLERYLAGEPIIARRVSPAARLWRWCRRRPMVASLTAAVVLLAATLAIGVPVVAVQRKYIGQIEDLAALNEIRQRRASAEDGWSRDVRELFSAAAARGIKPENLAQFRTELVATLDGLDTRPIVTLECDQGPVWGIDFSAKGTQFYTSGTNGSVAGWNFDDLIPKDDETHVPDAKRKAARRGELPHEKQPEDQTKPNLAPTAFPLIRRWVGETMLYARSPRQLVFFSSAPEPPGPPLLDLDSDVRCFSADATGQRLAVSCADGSAVLYELVNGKWNELRRFTVETPRSGLSSSMAVPIALSPDGKLFAAVTVQHQVRATAAPRREVRLFRVDDPKHEGTVLTRHRNHVKSLRFSRDGQWIASAADDYVAKVFDTSLREHPVTLHGHLGPVNAIDFSPQGEVVASGSQDGTIRLWHTRTGQQMRVFYPPMSYVHSLAFSPDGRHIVVGGNLEDEKGRISIHELHHEYARQALRRHLWSSVEGLAFHPTQPIVATAANDYDIFLWDLNQRKKLKRLPEFERHPATVTIQFSPDGAWLAVAPRRLLARNREVRTSDYAICLWRWPNSNQPERLLEGHEANIAAIAFDRTGQRLASGDQKGATFIWRLPRGEREARWQDAGGAVVGVMWLENGANLLTAHADGTLRIRNVTTGSPVRETTIGGRPTVLAPGRDSSECVIGTAEGNLFVVTLPSFALRELVTEKKSIEPEATAVSAIALSPDGRHLAAARQRQVSIWDLATGEMLLDLPPQDAPIYNLGFDPSGAKLVVTGREEQVTLWDWQRMLDELAKMGLAQR